MGKGGFGVVYKYSSPSVTFAGKHLILNPSKNFERDLKAAYEERKILKKFLNIKNIIHYKECMFDIEKGNLVVTLFTEKLDADLFS